MERDLLKNLIEWKHSTRRKPLILKGARQVGKTHLLKSFGQKEYEDIAYFNFEESPGLSAFFEGNLAPDAILQQLSIFQGKKILPEKTLIILDEIQAAPNALTSLKYFNESANQYHVAAAGSLLGIKLSQDKAFPVGKVNFFELHPLSFFEFLSAVGKQNLRQLLEGVSTFDPLPAPFHNELITLLRVYYGVGGMPEVVSSYADEKDFTVVRTIQKEILTSYTFDFAKYASPADSLKITRIWESIPGQLAKENKKFIFSAIEKSARAREYEIAIQWLKDAGLIHISYNISSPRLPLDGACDKSSFKVFLLDIGLLGAMVGLSSRTLVEGSAIFTEYKGAFVENYVAQELVAALGLPLYYWTSSGVAELDFVTAFESQIFPFEAKAGVSRKKKSLLEYGIKYSPPVLSRTTLMNFSRNGAIANYPLYAACLFPRLGALL